MNGGLLFVKLILTFSFLLLQLPQNCCSRIYVFTYNIINFFINRPIDNRKYISQRFLFRFSI